MTRIREVIAALESFAPLSLQESYDNSGLITGDDSQEVSNVLLTIDCTEDVVQDAIDQKCNLILAHHPIVFSGLKKLTGSNYVERTIIKAIKNDIAIYAIHTNLDTAKGGVNWKIAEKLDLQNIKVLDPIKGNLKKLVCFVPNEHLQKVANEVFEAGAGHIGQYDQCSFNAEGFGTFRAQEGSKPFVGEIDKRHSEKEIRFESIFRVYDEKKIIQALIKSHPYEEVAYDIYSIDNEDSSLGIGLYGELKSEVSLQTFLGNLKSVFNTGCIKYTEDLGKKIKKVALCGGSGSFLINKAIASGSDVFITSDIKYHQFFDADKKIVLADIGHFESEQFSVEVLNHILKENFNTFATYFSRVNTNPIKYF